MRHKWFWAILVCLMISPVMAQQQPVSEYTFKLSENDLNVISKGLGTQPFAEVAPLMQKMQKQFIDQQAKLKSVDPAKSDAEGREQLPPKPLKSE